jgi:hypothetical protein
MTKLQPRPSRKRPTMTTSTDAAPRMPQASAAALTAQPSAIVLDVPQRSDSQPGTGENPNMPSVWRLIVNPTRVSECPWLTRCTGVSDMIVTITVWFTASPTNA